MSKMRETLVETPSGPVLFQDFRPHRKKSVPGYHFGEGFVGQFCRCAAGSLLWLYATLDALESNTDFISSCVRGLTASSKPALSFQIEREEASFSASVDLWIRGGRQSGSVSTPGRTLARASLAMTSQGNRK